MQKDKFKYQIGDELYEVKADPQNYTTKGWKIVDIWVEQYVSGPKTIFKCESIEKLGDTGMKIAKEFDLSDILAMFESREAASAIGYCRHDLMRQEELVSRFKFE